MHEGLLPGIHLEENSPTYIYIHGAAYKQVYTHRNGHTFFALFHLPPPSLHTHFIQTYTHKHYIVLSMSSLF